MISNDVNISNKTSNSIIMMPKLQQAIYMLQLNNLELAEFIIQEVEKNPFLKKLENTITVGQSNKDNNDLFDKIASKESIYDILEREITLIAKSNNELEIVRYILTNTNSHGVIDISSTDIANKFNKATAEVDKIITKMQDSSLSGFFARNLKESIKIKLKNNNKLTNKLALIVDNIDFLISKNIHMLAKKCNLTIPEVISGLKIIEKIQPFSSFEDSDCISIKIPDVIISKINPDKWSIKLNEETLPRLIIDRHYEKIISEKIRQKNELAFVRDNVSEATTLIKSLDQRARTILNISKKIFEKQKMFFLYGENFLEPMTLKEIACELNIHESTVSRATSNKYILTEFGTYDMKSFFSNSLKDVGDCDISGKIIKLKLNKIIKQENKQNPLSDEEIAAQLLSDGINIARRTVSKYRANLNIPNSSKRKKII